MKKIIYLSFVIALVGVLTVSCEKKEEIFSSENELVVQNQTKATSPLGPYRKFDGDKCVAVQYDCFPVDIDVIDRLPVRDVKDFFQRNKTQLINGFIEEDVVNAVINEKYNAYIEYINERTNTYFIRVENTGVIYPIIVTIN